jgi:hypothetical protein
MAIWYWWENGKFDLIQGNDYVKSSLVDVKLWNCIKRVWNEFYLDEH